MNLGRTSLTMLVLASFAVRAQVATDRCEASNRLEAHRYLRQLSLDLRGRAPTYEEQEALGNNDVSVATIRAMLDSEEFKKRLALIHQDLLWTNIANVDITNFRSDMYPDERGIWGRPFMGIVYRGAPNVSCADRPAVIEQGVIATQVHPDNPAWRQEGWVLVEPYWAPGTQIKVCAFDAQSAELSVSGIPCNTNRGTEEASCGCGKNLRTCQAAEYRIDGNGKGYIFSTKSMIREGFQAEALKIVEDVVTSNRSYLDILRTNRGYINGPLAHFYRYQVGVSNYTATPTLVPMAAVPDVPFQDEVLRPIERDALHAGVLTTPAYLLRFQTNRGRANRFSNAFLCSAFLPPPGGLPLPEDECSKEPDLQARCGCMYCHVALEPMAAYWGRFAQTGMALHLPGEFPGFQAECADCNSNGRTCSQQCLSAYVTEVKRSSDQAFLGKLKELQFLSPENQANVEMGPRLLVEKSVFNDRLPSCIARFVWKRLMGRAMTGVEEVTELPRLVDAFTKSGYDFKTLVLSVVTSESYRSIG